MNKVKKYSSLTGEAIKQKEIEMKRSASSLFFSLFIVTSHSTLICMEKQQLYSTFSKQKKTIGIYKESINDLEKFKILINETHKTAEELTNTYQFTPRLVEQYLRTEEFNASTSYGTCCPSQYDREWGAHEDCIQQCATNNPETYKAFVLAILKQELARKNQNQNSHPDPIATARQDYFAITQKNGEWHKWWFQPSYLSTFLLSTISFLVIMSMSSAIATQC